MSPDRQADGPGRPEGDSPLRRRRLGVSLAVGSVVIVLTVLSSLAVLVYGSAAGVERGAIWAILLMILVTFATVGGIGYGFYRSSRDGTRDGPEGGGGG